MIIDGHNDLAWAMRQLHNYDLDAVDLAQHVPAFHTDISRLREGGVTGQFWSVYAPSTLSGSQAAIATVEQIMFVRAFIERFPKDLVFAICADDVIKSQKSARIASLLGVEGGHCIDESLTILEMFYALGARYMTLTHNHNTSWADSATDERKLGGLNSFGKEVVQKMNELGMLVDLSHVSAEVMMDALSITTAPAIFSHSSARALVNVARNVPDDVLCLLAKNGGVCMVAFYLTLSQRSLSSGLKIKIVISLVCHRLLPLNTLLIMWSTSVRLQALTTLELVLTLMVPPIFLWD